MIVVTRHQSLVAYLVAEGIVPPGTDVITHATPEAIRGQEVVGVLPLHLAAEAASVTVVTLALPPELRGVELSLDQVRAHAGQPVTYKVTKL